MSHALIANNLPIPSAIGSLDAYISAVNRIPVLTLEEEQALAHRFLAEEDLASARQLVLAHLRFVVHVARGYAGYGLQMGDLVQEGNIGLMKAVKRFDPDMGVRLVSSSCATGASSRSRRRRRSASCSSTCASRRSASAG